MKTKILTLAFFTYTLMGVVQQDITWKDLAKVTFVERYFPEHDAHFLYPYFSSSVKALEGKEIRIKGYFLNIDPEGEIYVLSKGPMSSCFFCGVGGPETAIELHFSKKPPFKTDDIISVKGILKLNSDDVNHFNYILNQSEGTPVN